MLRQKIRAGGVKIKTYEERNDQYYQNKLFQTNQKRFYEEIDKSSRSNNNVAPNPVEATKFWSNIWENNVTHDDEFYWIQDIENDLVGIDKPLDIRISATDVKKSVQKMSNWKAPGPDGVQGFWFKRLTSLHEQIGKHFQKCLDDGNVPTRMVQPF